MTEVAAGALIVPTIAELRRLVAERRAAGASIALVPTMGALHEGHLALVRRAAELADVVVVDPATFLPIADGYRGRALGLVAAVVGSTRLSDTAFVEVGGA